MSLGKPRFRRDLEASALDVDGQRYVEVRDPVTGGSFRFYDTEYHVALAFDGLAFDKVIAWLRLALGLEIDEGVLREFAARLHELGFLEPDEESAPGPLPAAANQAAPPRHEPSARSIETSEPVSAKSEVAIGRPVWQPAQKRRQEVPPPARAVKDVAKAPAPLRAQPSEAEPVPAHVLDTPPPVLVESGKDPIPSSLVPAEERVAAPSAPAAPAAETEAPALPVEVPAPSPGEAPPVPAAVPASAPEQDPPSPVEATLPPAPAEGVTEVEPRRQETTSETQALRAASEQVASVPAPTVASAEPTPPAPAQAGTEIVATPIPAEEAPRSQMAAAQATASLPVEIAELPLPVRARVAPEREYPPTVPAEGRRPDSPAFPVLPPSPVRVAEPSPPVAITPMVKPARTPDVTPTPSVTPTPVRPPPLSYVTPRPVTLPPLPVAQHAALRRRQRRSLVVFGSLGVVTAVAVLAIALPFFFPTREPPRADVRTLAVVPGTLLRYFASPGVVSPLPGPALKFPAAGKVTRIAKVGSQVAVGDIVAAVDAARPLLNQLAHQRERLAFYQQMLEGMHQVGNTAEEERQAAKVEVWKARVGKTLGTLASVAVVASTAGEVEEIFTAEGDTVEAGSLALRLRSSGHRATFDLTRGQAAEARRLGFCQVGVEGYVLDCTKAQSQNDDGRVVVEIASLPAGLVGRPARLARARFDGAVVLPAATVLNAGRRRQVLVVSPSGRVEARPVTVAEESANEAIVIQGLDAGENVILAPTPNLRPGARVSVRH